jgi:hypothetical protein
MALERRATALAVFCAAVAACIPYGDVWFQFSGRVVDAEGTPVESAKLEIRVDSRLAGHRSIETTNADGEYKFFESSCPCDFSFELRASKEGYEPYVLTLPGRQANTLKRHDITMRRLRHAG